MNTLRLLSFLGCWLISYTVVAQCKATFNTEDPSDGTIYLQTSQFEGHYNYRTGTFIHPEGGLWAVDTTTGLRANRVLAANNIWLGDKVYGQPYVRAKSDEPLEGGMEAYAFLPGPLDMQNGLLGGPLENGCINYDRPWIVYGEDILNHIQDWEADGVIDNMIPSIMAWPGKNNPHFEAYNGFSLPDSIIELAPFIDLNDDGIYDPMTGDFPYYKWDDVFFSSTTIPAQIIWSVVNDYASFDVAEIENLRLQIGITTWFYECNYESIGKGIIFTNFDIHSYLGDNWWLGDFRFGMWMDPNLGCEANDYVGAYGRDFSTHDFYVYNVDPESCETPIFSIGSKKMQLSSFITHRYDENSFPFLLPPMDGYPEQFYHNLNGRRIDGNYTYYKFDGFNITNYEFDELPSEPNSWSMLGMFGDSLTFDVKSVASYSADEFSSLYDNRFNITLMYQLHDNPGFNSMEDFERINEEKWELREWFYWFFGNDCSITPRCSFDCIWTGDTDANGIVDQFDLLPIGAARGQTGETRNPPYDWAPRSGSDWDLFLSTGVDYKHIDVDGNGVVEYEIDWDLSRLFYKRTNSYYQAPDPSYPQGEELSIDVIYPLDYDLDNAQAGDSIVLSITLHASNNNIRGLAYGFTYNREYFSQVQLSDAPATLNYFVDQEQDGLFESAIIAADNDDVLSEGELFQISFKVKDEFVEPLLTSDSLFRLQNLSAIDPNGNYLDIGATDLGISFPGVPVYTQEVTTQSIDIYPNPANKLLTVKFGDITAHSIRMLQINGQQIGPNKSIQTNDLETSIDISQLKPGLYFLQVDTDQGRLTKRFIKI